MNEEYLTVEQVSEKLSMHPKTIQRYIREGKLRAAKVGKSWRVNGYDLSVFLENTSVHGDSAETERTITVSSVIDITTNGADDAIRIMNMLTAAFNSKPPEFSKTSMQAQYIEHERMVRLMLWGNIRFISLITGMIITITDTDKE